MPSVDRTIYEALRADLSQELNKAASRFAHQRGLVWDVGSYLRQSSHTGETVREVLTFGMDVWPSDDDGREGILLPIAANDAVRGTNRLVGVIAACMAMVGICFWTSADDPVAAGEHVRYTHHDALAPVTATTSLLPDAAV